MHYAWQIKKLLANNNCSERREEKRKRETERDRVEEERGNAGRVLSPSCEFCLANSACLRGSLYPLPLSPRNNVQCTLTASLGWQVKKGQSGKKAAKESAELATLKYGQIR